MTAALRERRSRMTDREFKDLPSIWVNTKTALDSEYLVLGRGMRKHRRVFARSPQQAIARVARFEGRTEDSMVPTEVWGQR